MAISPIEYYCRFHQAGVVRHGRVVEDMIQSLDGAPWLVGSAGSEGTDAGKIIGRLRAYQSGYRAWAELPGP